MKQLKNLGISLLIGVCLILILSFIFNLFYYFDIMKEKTFDISKMIITIISLFISGIILGKKSKKKGWLEGIKLSICFIAIILLINTIFIKQFSLQTILYYLIISLSCIFGSMIGINKKKS